MLEKMGWKSGEGLGVNKQGITEHIKVAYKNDNKCLGYKEKSEEWVEHQSQFENLLSELSSSHSIALDSGNDKTSQTETLEQRSRHSRTRVHYQKFTRGKDLSKYSEKDLKCILLGKQEGNSAGEEDKDYGGNEYFNGFYGVKTINSGSMNDYFEKFNSHNHLDTYISPIQFGEKSNNVGAQCDVKVNKKKKKAEIQMSDSENSNLDSNEAPSIKQHENKMKKFKDLEHSDSTNDHPYIDFETGSVSESKLQKEDKTDVEGAISNGICNEELHFDEKCKRKRPKKKNYGIEDRESEIMEIEEIENKQVNKKSKKKNSELVNEGEDTSLLLDVSGKSENSKAVGKCLTIEVDDEIEIKPPRKKSRKKSPVSPSKEKTTLVSVECVSHDSQNVEDIRLHLTAELDELEGKKRKKKCKSKKQKFTGDYEETSVNVAEVISYRLENSKNSEDKQLKKKGDLLSESGEISILPAENVSYRLENSRDTEQDLIVEVTDEIGWKKLKKKSKKKKNGVISENGGASAVPVEDISLMFGISENIAEHLIDKDEERLTTDIHGAYVSPVNKLKVVDINRLDHDTRGDNEVQSKEQTVEVPTKRKKKKNTKIDIESSVVEDISKHVNGISVEKGTHKTKKDENEVRQSEQADPVIKEGKKVNADEEPQSVENSMCGRPQLLINENVAEKLNKGCSESRTKFYERYSVDEIKKMKYSLFAQLVDPKLVKFKGSNLHRIAGYGKS